MPPDRACAIARCLGAAGGLDQAIALARNQDAHQTLADLCGYRQALQEAEDPSRLCARLRSEAATFDRLEERARLQAAEYIGRALFREKRGDAFATQLHAQAGAAERCADDYQSRALDKRRAAAALDPALPPALVQWALGAGG